MKHRDSQAGATHPDPATSSARPDPTGSQGFTTLPVDPDITETDRDLHSPRDGAAPRAAHAPATGGASTSSRGRPRGRSRLEYLSTRIRRVLTQRGDILAVIAAGGALGSLARWQLSQQLPHPADGFAWATFDANVAGCLLLGVLMVFVADVWPPSRYLRPFLGVGVLGGFTTFSTYMLDTRALLLTGHTATAGAYLFGSLTAGLVAVWSGVTLTRLAVRTAQHRRLRSLRRQAQTRRAQRQPSSTPPASTTRSPR